MGKLLSKVDKGQHIPVPRITQLDSLEFDGHIRSILWNQLSEISRFLGPGSLSWIEPELELILDILIVHNSVFKSNATFGQQLLDLKYDRDVAHIRKIGFIMFHIVFPYVWRRYEKSNTTRASLKRLITDFELLPLKIFRLLNLLIFLREGLFPSLSDWLLGLRYVNVKRLNRNIGYHYIARELLWHGIMELLMFALPLINFQVLKRRIKSLWTSSKARKQIAPPTLNLSTRCECCKLRPTNPCRISVYCTHVACYLCIQGNIMADEKFCCPSCNVPNTAVDHLEYITCSSS